MDASSNRNTRHTSLGSGESKPFDSFVNRRTYPDIQRGIWSRRTKNPLDKVDFSKLGLPTLRKFKRVYNIKARSTTKSQLVKIINEHCSKLQIDEREIVSNFISLVKKKRSQINRT